MCTHVCANSSQNRAIRGQRQILCTGRSQRSPKQIALAFLNLCKMVFNKRLLTERVEESLVNGFTRQLVTRGSGKTKGGIDIYVFAPDRTRFRSRVELKQYLKNYEGEKIDPDVAFRRPTKNKIKMVKMHSKDKFQNKKILRVKLANIKKGSQLTLRQVDQLAGKAGLPIVKVSLERLEAEEVDTGHREPDVGEDSDVAEDDFFNHFTMIHGDHHSGMELGKTI
ncbi:Hypothetical predicted protein [Cloeon dipterum]|uniref:MBD domain-containing protein n=1 Tax=Cloeon dipterum TaxID=197152 RepID=A0A8S1BS86_9INSE|nr:Hypothetical predicted protein [Cloeon dipterum]